MRVSGRHDGVSARASANFQRVTSTSFRSSNLTITVSSCKHEEAPGSLQQRGSRSVPPPLKADSTGVITPGTPFSVPFSVKSYGLGGNFTVRATNSRLYDLTYPTSLSLTAGKSSNATVTIMATGDIASGTDVTLTIEVEAPLGQDTNYAVLRFSVMTPVTLLIPPVSFQTPVCRWAVLFALITITLPGARPHSSTVSADQPARRLPPRLQFLQVDALSPGVGRGRRLGRRQCYSENWQRDLGGHLWNHNPGVLQRLLLRAHCGAAGCGQGGKHGVLFVLSLQQNYAIALALPDRSHAGDPHEEMRSSPLLTVASLRFACLWFSLLWNV